MGKRIREHLRANVIGYVALFFVMSLGTAYAIDKNAIKSKHIGNGQVKLQDLAGGSVNGSKVVDNSLNGDDVDESSLNLPEPPSIPSTLPPSGAAGGDLTGEYPNPQIGANVVTGAEVDEASLAGLVNGSGRVLNGTATSTGQTILTLPGWGDLKVFNCTPNATASNRQAMAEFDSTGPSGTTWTIGGTLSGSFQAAYSSNSTPAFGSAVVGNSQANEGFVVFLTRDDSPQTAVLSIGEKTTSTTCEIRVQAQIVG